MFLREAHDHANAEVGNIRQHQHMAQCVGQAHACKPLCHGVDKLQTDPRREAEQRPLDPAHDPEAEHDRIEQQFNLKRPVHAIHVLNSEKPVKHEHIG